MEGRSADMEMHRDATRAGSISKLMLQKSTRTWFYGWSEQQRGLYPLADVARYCSDDRRVKCADEAQHTGAGESGRRETGIISRLGHAS